MPRLCHVYSEVGNACHELNVEVLGIVLLELHTLWTCGLVYGVIVEFFQQDVDFLLVVLVDDDWLLGCLLLFGLDLHVPGHEWLGSDFFGDFNNLFLVLLERDVEDGCVDVGSGLDELKVNGVVEVELERSRHSLQSAPEKLSGLFDDVIGRESVEQLLDLVVEDVLEDTNSQLHTNFI